MELPVVDGVHNGSELKAFQYLKLCFRISPQIFEQSDTSARAVPGHVTFLSDVVQVGKRKIQFAGTTRVFVQVNAAVVLVVRVVVLGGVVPEPNVPFGLVTDCR